ncbi:MULTISPECIES: hypothetical protein [unclassified Cellulophaga]|uniref:hypothetical protein n=1 Tax=unclassified Cellulophaga TaxID=2634405 RepID=UPI001F103BAA|nr:MULTISPECIES: hypothetical protein [unclassified Cellulophaga]
MMRKSFPVVLGAFLVTTMMSLNAQEIPVENLSTDLPLYSQQYAKTILADEIKGIHVEHIALTGKNTILDATEDGNKLIYLFFKGNGTVTAEGTDYAIVPETILLPNAVEEIQLKTTANDTLHYLRIASKLSKQDLIDLETFPKENTQHVYYKKFTDCEPYTEPIKSPNTVSRTIMPNKIIPRIAMGTVQTTGPDKVDPHEHPMLEQLFLGLSENDVVVYADDESTPLNEYALLHIPLGSSHSVTVEKEKVMYYVWMDFFLDAKGEEWLKTHQVIEKENE